MRRRLARWLEQLAWKIRPTYRPAERCKTCRYELTNHAQTCPVGIAERTDAEWRKLAESNYRAMVEANKRARNAWQRAHFWEGKFNTLRLENNALRKRARLTTQAMPEDENGR